MTVDDHTAPKATQAIESGISDHLELLGAGYIDDVDAEFDRLASCLAKLGSLVHTLSIIKNREVA